MTTVAIHQPNYLPYLGYFDKIDRADVFVLLDSVTYTHNDWRNRNRIKTPQGERWLTVPVVRKGALKTLIRDARINGSGWRRKHWMTLEQSYSRSPHFAKYRGFFERVYETEWKLLGAFDEFLVRKMCGFLGIEATIVRASSLGGIVGAKTDLLVSICKTLGADRYISGVGAERYMDRGKFEEAGIEVVLQDFECPVYDQMHGGFVPDLSAVDYLFNCGNPDVRAGRGAPA